MWFNGDRSYAENRLNSCWVWLPRFQTLGLVRNIVARQEDGSLVMLLNFSGTPSRELVETSNTLSRSSRGFRDFLVNPDTLTTPAAAPRTPREFEDDPDEDDDESDVAPRRDRLPSTTLALPLAEFQFRPPELGLIQAGQYAVFASRFAIRRDWKQGMRYQQYRQTFVRSARSRNVPGGTDFFREHSRAVTNTILGRFISLQDAILRVEEYAESVAISRRLALTRDFQLVYRGRSAVGRLQENDRIQLSSGSHWIAEEVEEALGDQALVR